MFNLCLEYSRSAIEYGGVGPWIFIFIYIPSSIYTVFIISWWLNQSCSGARKVWQRIEARQDAVVFAISWRLSCFNKHLDHRQVFFTDDFTLELSSFLSLFLGYIAKKYYEIFAANHFIFKNLGRRGGMGRVFCSQWEKKEHAILNSKTVHFYVPLTPDPRTMFS